MSSFVYAQSFVCFCTAASKAIDKRLRELHPTPPCSIIAYYHCICLRAEENVMDQVCCPGDRLQASVSSFHLFRSVGERLPSI